MVYTRLIRLTFVRIFVLFSLLASLEIIASGTRGYRGQSSIKPRQVDHTYEYGKSVFNGRAKSTKKYAYCVKVEGEKIPLKKRSIKSFKKGTVVAFANALYDCDRPNQKIGLEMAREDFQSLIYYLNKRYRMKLSN